MNIEDLPAEWHRHVKDLRAENARLRRRCKRLKAQLEATQGDVQR